MAAITHVGNKLLIIRGQWRGWVGEIKEVKHLPCGLIDYVMEIDDSDEDTYNKLEITVQAEDCREYCPGSINLEDRFDITNYLSVNQMRDIAKEVYTTKISTYIDDVFNNRVKTHCGSIPNQVIHEIVQHHAGEMWSQYQDDMLKLFRKIITEDTPLVDDEDIKSFGRSIQWALERVATKYIEDHPEEITEMMKDEIAKNAKRMVEEQWSYSMSKAMENLAKDLVNKGLNIVPEKK